MKIFVIMNRTLEYIKKALNNAMGLHQFIRPVSSVVILGVAGIVFTGLVLTSCQEFVTPDQELVMEKEDMYENWEEYRSAEMGLYALQQNLVEQLMVLGELRGDLLEVTDNATPDLIEVQNFNIQKDNPYASPVNFYKLILACNKLIQQLENAHPNVLDKTQEVNNYDRLYGEALCMRGWAYFNAVRIYGEVPYIHKSLTDVEEIEAYVNSEVEFVDSMYIDYDIYGLDNDTIRDTTIVLEKRFLDQKAVIDTFTHQLENDIKAVGVNHSVNNDDRTWLVTVWNDYARHVLLGKMYMYDQNYGKAIEHLDYILYDYTSEGGNIKYALDGNFANNNWQSIFTDIRPFEHIYALSFSKSYKQTHDLQTLLSIEEPNEYMMKPTSSSVINWEGMWDSPQVRLNNDNPRSSRVTVPGTPGDYYRGYGVSYQYYKNGVTMTDEEVAEMLEKKRRENYIDVRLMMDNVDTVATKYNIGKNRFSNDANFIVYRAAGVHLYAAEIYTLWKYKRDGGSVGNKIFTAVDFLNDGRHYEYGNHMGVRGRVGFADGYEAIRLYNIIYRHDPTTNRIVGYYDFTGNTAAKQAYLIDVIMEERARELAFEGERFYDLMRVAKRRGDPSFLADKVADKFSGAQKEAIRAKLMNEQNWYIDYYD